MPNAQQLTFRKSSFSGATTQNCVEIADFPGGSAVRDSQNPTQRHLEVPAREWSALLASVSMTW
ncbi:DUF397 domain-containing protein [Nocardiopsis sp. NRRL B-16309]|uniref:DUF397 domain-containing protein n=1 Tax=Nocardiopsis sp. NRRL B-16309 TaxID=1519494 RepID=UPI0006AE813D|nr:DUF397 domain-containing protein [Nocardiopsis sp. NRRL B-16309]